MLLFLLPGSSYRSSLESTEGSTRCLHPRGQQVFPGSALDKAKVWALDRTCRDRCSMRSYCEGICQASALLSQRCPPPSGDRGFPWVPPGKPAGLTLSAIGPPKSCSVSSQNKIRVVFCCSPQLWCLSGFIPARRPLLQGPGAAPAFLEKITADLSRISQALGWNSS